MANSPGVDSDNAASVDEAQESSVTPAQALAQVSQANASVTGNPPDAPHSSPDAPVVVITLAATVELPAPGLPYLDSTKPEIVLRSPYASSTNSNPRSDGKKPTIVGVGVSGNHYLAASAAFDFLAMQRVAQLAAVNLELLDAYSALRTPQEATDFAKRYLATPWGNWNVDTSGILLYPKQPRSQLARKTAQEMFAGEHMLLDLAQPVSRWTKGTGIDSHVYGKAIDVTDASTEFMDRYGPLFGFYRENGDYLSGGAGRRYAGPTIWPKEGLEFRIGNAELPIEGFRGHYYHPSPHVVSTQALVGTVTSDSATVQVVRNSFDLQTGEACDVLTGREPANPSLNGQDLVQLATELLATIKRGQSVSLSVPRTTLVAGTVQQRATSAVRAAKAPSALKKNTKNDKLKDNLYNFQTGLWGDKYII